MSIFNGFAFAGGTYTIDYLVVGGGGGGGFNGGGGGGAGGLLSGSFNVTPNASYTILIGNGGNSQFDSPVSASLSSFRYNCIWWW
jgi:hypothetical protein